MWIEYRDEHGVVTHRTWRWRVPRIPDEWLQSVVFLYPPDREDLGGTAFVIGYPAERLGPGWVHNYVVTAAHVVKKACGGRPRIRVNVKDGPAKYLETQLEDWRFHPRLDVAVKYITFGSDIQFEVGHIDCSLVMAEDEFRSDEVNVGIGDDVFMVGRYVGMDEQNPDRITPVLRSGSIAALGDLRHPFHIPDVGPQPGAFLVDMRSRFGYSGSFVMLNRLWAPSMLEMGTRVTIPGKEPYESEFWPAAGVIGVDCAFVRDHGEVWECGPADDGSLDRIRKDVYTLESSGLSIVVPSWAILDLTEDDEAMSHRKQDEDEILAKRKKRKARISPASKDTGPKRPGPEPERLQSDDTMDELAKRVMDAGKPDEWDEEGER